MKNRFRIYIRGKSKVKRWQRGSVCLMAKSDDHIFFHEIKTEVREVLKTLPAAASSGGVVETCLNGVIKN
jgi:hypothetical protein